MIWVFLWANFWWNHIPYANVSTRTVSLMPDTIKLTVGRSLTSLVTPEAKHEHNVKFSHNGNTISSGGRRHGARVCRSHCQASACSDGWLSAGSLCRFWPRSSPASLPAFEPWKPVSRPSQPGAPLSCSWRRWRLLFPSAIRVVPGGRTRHYVHRTV